VPMYRKIGHVQDTFREPSYPKVHQGYHLGVVEHKIDESRATCSLP
jgi:hypothetical protein